MCFLGANFCIILPTYKSFSKYRHSTVSSLQGLTCPQGASSMCTDAWPFPLGLWLALHQSSRGRAWEGKGWRWEEREEEAREQNTKFHLFWVGWLIFLAWREKLWIQFVPLANCVPESLGGAEKWQMADKLYSGSGQGWIDLCWDGLCLAQDGSEMDV